MDYVTREQFDVFLREETEHHNRDEANLRSVEVSVAAVGQQVAGVGLQLAASQKQLEQHHMTIYGNGKPGMDEQIRQIFEWMQRQDGEREKKEKEDAELNKEKRDNQQFWIRFGVTTAIINGLTIIGALITWFVKILPILDALQK